MTWTGQNHYADVALANYSSKLCGKRDMLLTKGIFTLCSLPLIFLFYIKATVLYSEVFQFHFQSEYDITWITVFWFTEISGPY